jgi:hypothetical protein
MEFLTKEEFEKISSYEVFNEVLSRLFNKAIETAMISTPALAAQLIKRGLAMKQLAAEFFENNPELAAHRSILEKVVMEVDAANPGATYEDILKKAAPIAKEKIKLIESGKSLQMDFLGG